MNAPTRKQVHDAFTKLESLNSSTASPYDYTSFTLDHNDTILVALRACEGEGTVEQPTGIVRLTGQQVKNALEFVAPDGNDADQLETEICIQWLPKRVATNGEDMDAGYYVWIAEYPEEGVMPLDGTQNEDVSAVESPEVRSDEPVAYRHWDLERGRNLYHEELPTPACEPLFTRPAPSHVAPVQVRLPVSRLADIYSGVIDRGRHQDIFDAALVALQEEVLAAQPLLSHAAPTKGDPGDIKRGNAEMHRPESKVTYAIAGKEET